MEGRPSIFYSAFPMSYSAFPSSMSAANSAMQAKSDLPERSTGSSIGSQTPRSVVIARFRESVTVSPASEVMLTVFIPHLPQVISWIPAGLPAGGALQLRELPSQEYHGALRAVHRQDGFRSHPRDIPGQSHYSAYRKDKSRHKNDPRIQIPGVILCC